MAGLKDDAFEVIGAIVSETPLSFMITVVAIMLLIYAGFPRTREGGRSGKTLTVLLLITGIPMFLIGFLQMTESPALKDIIETSDTGVVLFTMITLPTAVVGAIVTMGILIPFLLTMTLALAGKRSV